ncbi:hypothetical protein [Streptomyces sp. NPDC055085]
MTDPYKPDVYRKAAEIIVRDGKHEGGFTPRGSFDREAVKDPSLPVCAMGACARAEWELYGTLPVPSSAEGAWSGAVHGAYSYQTSWGGMKDVSIWAINDIAEGPLATSAEDIALLLKQHAADLEEGDHA